MPYILPHRRTILEDSPEWAEGAGDLNYLLTKVCQKYLGDMRSYAMYNEVIGALECCKLELYRRMVAPYEDEKCKANGDVYV